MIYLKIRLVGTSRTNYDDDAIVTRDKLLSSLNVYMLSPTIPIIRELNNPLAKLKSKQVGTSNLMSNYDDDATLIQREIN